MTETYFLVDDDGSPLGVIDRDQIDQDGTALAFGLAAIAGDEPAVDKLLAETLERVGASAFGYVCANALHTMTVAVVSGLTDVAEVASPGIRQGLIAFAEGRDPREATA